MKKKPSNLDPLSAYESALKTIESTYESDESGRRFIHHLINAFLTKYTYPVVISKYVQVDCLTGAKLKPMGIIKKVPEEVIKLYINLLNSISEEEKDEAVIEDRLNELLEKTREIEKTIPSSRMAFKSTISNKCMGAEEITALKRFTLNELGKGNPVIKRMVSFRNGTQLDRDEVVKSGIEMLKNKFGGN